MKRITRAFSRLFERYFDDLLLVFGCICILRGLSKWNIPVTWVVGGLMLIGFGVLIGKLKAEVKDVDHRSS